MLVRQIRLTTNRKDKPNKNIVDAFLGVVEGLCNNNGVELRTVSEENVTMK